MAIAFSSLLVPAPQASTGLCCEDLAGPMGVDALRPQMVRDLRYASGSIVIKTGSERYAFELTGE